MDILEILKECGGERAFSLTGYHPFTLPQLQQFAQRIEQPHLQRIAELEALVKGYRKDFEILSTTESATLRNRTKQIEQLREALLQCKGFVDAYGQPEAKEIVRKALEETK